VNLRDKERIEEALGDVPLEELLFVTLTFDRKRYRDAGEAWRSCRVAWKRFRDLLAYRYAKGEGRARSKQDLVYVQTWEQHKDGWPHVHALVWSKAMASDVRRRGSYSRDVRGALRPIWRWVAQVARPAAISSGFGPILDVQFPEKERGALAGYLVKIAAELTGCAKKDQTPVLAPKGFRRIRSTPKFLEPARISKHEFTAELLLAPVEWIVGELHCGAATFKAAADAARTRIERWLRPRSVPSAESCTTRAASPPTELALTA
jgi:hypothetical protein